jgi:hypothetical protein
MSPWAFGIEAEPGSLTNYRLDRAWQLDQLFNLADDYGIYLMLCLDYHGMFQTQPDNFGGNDNWKDNPYNQVNGGPCVKPNDFFKNSAAAAIYRKPHDYLVSRYSANQKLLAWEFFNEIDNVYNLLNATDVANWHKAMGQSLRAADPGRHLITTSLTSISDRPEIWSLPEMDFAIYHSYNLAAPAAKLPAILQGMWNDYQKPVMLSEYGIDYRGWNRADDPFLRGFRQGVWSALLGGSVGTGMSWWWENLHSENVYPFLSTVSKYLAKSGAGRNNWTPLQFITSGEPPARTGNLISNAPPFTATLNLSAQWGLRTSGQLALTRSDDAARAPAILDAFFQGTVHPELRNPCLISAWVGADARLVLHLNSVSSGAIINIRVDGSTILGKSLVNKDGGYDVNNEYNEDIAVAISPGNHLIEIRNAGADWFYLDWVRFENILPSEYAGDWKPSPVAVGMGNPGEALVYVVNPAISFPGNATNATIPALSGQFIQITNWDKGDVTAVWMDAATGTSLGKTRGRGASGLIQIPLPDFTEDLAGRIIPDIKFEQVDLRPNASVELKLNAPAPSHCEAQSSEDLSHWNSLGEIPFNSESVEQSFSTVPGARYFRVTTAE